MLALNEPSQGPNRDPFLCVHVLSVVLQHNQAIPLDHRAQDARALVAAQAHTQLAFCIVSCHASLKLRAAFLFLDGLFAQGLGCGYQGTCAFFAPHELEQGGSNQA